MKQKRERTPSQRLDSKVARLIVESQIQEQKQQHHFVFQKLS